MTCLLRPAPTYLGSTLILDNSSQNSPEAHDVNPRRKGKRSDVYSLLYSGSDNELDNYISFSGVG
jgi:hypothetical protein